MKSSDLNQISKKEHENNIPLNLNCVKFKCYIQIINDYLISIVLHDDFSIKLGNFFKENQSFCIIKMFSTTFEKIFEHLEELHEG